MVWLCIKGCHCLTKLNHSGFGREAWDWLAVTAAHVDAPAKYQKHGHWEANSVSALSH